MGAAGVRGSTTSILDAQLQLVPASEPTLDWIVKAPWFGKHYGYHGQHVAHIQPMDAGLRGCPPGLEDFVLKLLRVEPSERLSAASAIQHLFLNPTPVLPRPVSVTMGKRGMGTIAQGNLAPEVLQYLQDDPDLDAGR